MHGPARAQWLRAWRRMMGAWALALTVCAQAGAAEPLRLAVARGPVSLSFYVAAAKGYFAEAGTTVDMVDCASGRACFERMAAGQADAATAAELLVTLASFNDARFAVLASVSSSVHQIKLVARQGEGVAPDGAWLRGKRVGTVAGTSAQYYLDTWLLYHGIGAESVTRVNLPPERLAPALARGEIDAVAIWEPHAADARAALGESARLLPNPRVYTQHFTLVGPRPALAGRAADFAALLRALARAQAFIVAQPGEARGILAARLQVSPEAASALMAEHDFRLRIDQTLIATMDSQARWAAHAGLVPPGRRPGNLLRAIEPALLRKAVPGAVDLVH